MRIDDPSRPKHQNGFPKLLNADCVVPSLRIIYFSENGWLIGCFVPTSNRSFTENYISVCDITSLLEEYSENPEEFLIKHFKMSRVITNTLIIDNEGRKIGTIEEIKKSKSSILSPKLSDIEF